MAYLLDANVLIEAKNRYYGFDLCPGFWDWIDAAHERGEVFSVEAIKDELIGGADPLADWVSARPALFLEPDTRMLDSARALTAWTTRNERGYRPAAITTFRASADYLLIAHAHAHAHVVVTHEVTSEGYKKIKIPEACVALDVRYTTPFRMLSALRARFVLASATGPQQESLL